MMFAVRKETLNAVTRCSLRPRTITNYYLLVSVVVSKNVIKLVDFVSCIYNTVYLVQLTKNIAKFNVTKAV